MTAEYFQRICNLSEGMDKNRTIKPNGEQYFIRARQSIRDDVRLKGLLKNAVREGWNEAPIDPDAFQHRAVSTMSR